MEQLIIFLLFVIGSIISSIIQHKKKQAEEQQQRELEEATRRPAGNVPLPPPRAETQWPPRTPADWHEQLRRMLQGETPEQQPPPVIKPVLLPPVQKQQPVPEKPEPEPRRTPPPISETGKFTRPLQTSAANYQRAANLHAAVEDRMRAVTQQTATHRRKAAARQRSRSHSDFVRTLRRNPSALREAFIATLIFGPAKGIEDQPMTLR